MINQASVHDAVLLTACDMHVRCAGDMLRDLDAELAGYAQRRRQARGRGDSASSAPKSLWEELYGIGEELVEALEKVT